MATRKFLIEVEKGHTECDECPFQCRETCCYPYLLDKVMGCEKYNLATMKIKEIEIPECDSLEYGETYLQELIQADLDIVEVGRWKVEVKELEEEK